MRLLEISKEILKIRGKTITYKLDCAEDTNLQASMTLFSKVKKANPVFKAVLKKYFEGQPHRLTVRLLGEI